MLEVLVALVLMATVGVAIIVWVQGGLDSVQRMRSVNATLQAQRQIAEWSQGLNPMVTPSGEVELGALRVAWEATEIAPPIAQAGFPRYLGPNDVALYRVVLKVYSGKQTTPWFGDTVERLGFKKVREVVRPF